MKRLYSALLEQSRKKYPNLEDKYRYVKKHSDKTANGLTSAIIAYLTATGHMAERVSNTGRYLDTSTSYVDVLGVRRKIGGGKWIPGSGKKGTADIHAQIKKEGCQYAIPVKIEVKMKDRQSAEQKQYEQDVEQSGGVYWVVRTFDDFMNKLETL